jgi:hypothetical protein
MLFRDSLIAVVFFWLLTICVSVCPLVISKYIPADSSKFPSCRKAFINVLASSEDDYDAVVCCNGDNSETSLSLCAPKVGRLAYIGSYHLFVTDCVFHFDRVHSQSIFRLPVV